MDFWEWKTYLELCDLIEIEQMGLRWCWKLCELPGLTRQLTIKKPVKDDVKIIVHH